jgi:enamine deaminase RidA (YjgF/YER057c/UK114 family)
LWIVYVWHRPIVPSKTRNGIRREGSSSRLCVLHALAAVKAEIGALEKVRRVAKVIGYVASDAGFNGQPGVMNGASDLLGEIFGEKGIHARTAVGVAELSLAAPVEVQFMIKLSEEQR